MKYHDRMYRNLIFDDYDGWSNYSWVLPWSDPDFYIRLGGARGCRAGRRVQHELLHYWRAVIPILAEQLTGEPYTRRVRAGCGNRARQYGWIIVEYVTPAEYHRETGREWGEGVLARASLGSTYGKIWIRSFPKEDQLSQLWKNIIAHEIGHAFGLNHTGRPDLIMSASIGEERPNTLEIFLPIEEGTAPPDHSTLSRTRRLIDVETHQAVFTWVLQRLADAQLVKGRTLGIDATTLEANAALRSIVRRDTGEAYEAWLTRLAEASGIATPTRAELARFDRKRKKKGSNDDWTHPQDPDAKITKLKDGRTHLAHTAEHAVDLETGAVVSVTVQDADDGDTTTMVETLITAADQVEAVLPAGAGIAEVVADKGYHSNATMVAFAAVGVRSYVSEPDRGRRNWKGKAAAREAVYANRRRIRGARGQRLLRQRGERLERPNAHLYETGRMRRVHLRGHPNILKRVLVQVCGFNLGLLMRQLTGVGTPRSLQGRAVTAFSALLALLSHLWSSLSRSWSPAPPDRLSIDPTTRCHEHLPLDLRRGAFATGC